MGDEILEIGILLRDLSDERARITDAIREIDIELIPRRSSRERQELVRRKHEQQKKLRPLKARCRELEDRREFLKQQQMDRRVRRRSLGDIDQTLKVIDGILQADLRRGVCFRQEELQAISDLHARIQ